MSNNNITTIPTSKIVIRDDRLRAMDESAVTALAHDIKSYGQTQPIEVRKLGNGRFELIDGGHRAAALELLGWKAKAIVRDCTVDEAKMRMALANLTRAELSMLDRARHVWRVKSLWMKLHPERTHGGFRKAGECQAATASTWTEAIPAGAHLSDRTLARAAKIGEEIAPKAAGMVYDCAIADTQKELLELVTYSPEVQCLKFAEAQVAEAPVILSNAPANVQERLMEFEKLSAKNKAKARKKVVALNLFEQYRRTMRVRDALSAIAKEYGVSATTVQKRASACRSRPSGSPSPRASRFRRCPAMPARCAGVRVLSFWTSLLFMMMPRSS